MSKKVTVIDKYNFYEYLSVMLDWWVWIWESLESVWEKITSPYFKQKIDELLIYISSWDSFSKSMKKIPQIFESSETSIIEAGETTWMLSESLSKLSFDLKKVYELRNKVKWALTYPFIIFLFLFLAIWVVLTYVIPAIQPLFETTETQLPIATQALIATSEFLRSNSLLLLLMLASIYVAFLFYKNTVSWKKQIESFVFNLPLIWIVYKNYILSNIASTFWSLIWSGVSVMKSLTLTWKSTNNLIYMELFDQVIMDVSTWKKIVESMRNSDPDIEYFPSSFLQMLSVWEKTATLEKISKKLSISYEREVDNSLANLTKWIEPIAILFAWIFVIWFAFAIFWAILKVTQTVW
jgi:type IV pilus assembly protein PilC